MFESYLRTAFRPRALFVPAVVGLSLAAQPASAAIMMLTQTAKIWGVQNASAGMSERLAGKTLTYKIVYDTEKGEDRYQFTQDAGTGQRLTEKVNLDLTIDGNPFVSGSYKLGDDGDEYAMDFSTSFALEYDSVFGGPFFNTQMQLQGASSGPDGELRTFKIATLGTGIGVMPFDLTKPFSAFVDVTSTPNDNVAFRFTHTGLFGEEFADLILTAPEGQNSAAFIDIRPVGPGQPGAVPEPSTWAMLILGFGASGALLRRRRALAVA